ncbi:hypothetical protein H0A65_17315 [Alcaligenaceae bacterium]|nr:hypothetical protein [Alcaligenaceae bacterium]
MGLAMDIPDYTKLTVAELLNVHSAVLGELRNRNVTRSNNNPTGDYAEWLVATALGLTLEKNSAKGFDAVDSQGIRYQIKSRRVTPNNASTQLGVIRNLDGGDFDFLVAVIFNSNWQVSYAAKISHHVLPELAAYRSHVNGHIMHLRPSVFTNPGVEDISDQLRQ